MNGSGRVTSPFRECLLFLASRLTSPGRFPFLNSDPGGVSAPLRMAAPHIQTNLTSIRSLDATPSTIPTGLKSSNSQRTSSVWHQQAWQEHRAISPWLEFYLLTGSSGISRFYFRSSKAEPAPQTSVTVEPCVPLVPL